MVGNLLLRGMLVGLVAGLLSFAFLKVWGEPQVERAIAFEEQMNEATAGDRATGAAMPAHEHEEELVSRPVQAGLGLFVGVTVYGAAFGGLFALAFAIAYGRLGDAGPRGASAILAAAGFIAIYVVPNLKYPANPPSIGAAATIGVRTALYFAMIAFSLAAMLGAALLRSRLVRTQGRWNASLMAGAVYLLAMILVGLAMPAVNEVPEQFPAVTLWAFRVASFGAQAVMWTTIGLVFGALTHRVSIRPGVRRLDAAVI